MTKYHLLPGSLEIFPDSVTAGVLMGDNEWDIASGTLRYVTAPLDKEQVTITELMDLLRETYENSTGCQVAGTFQMNKETA